MIELAKVSVAAFSASVFLDEKGVSIRLAGRADVAAKPHLTQLFTEAHLQALSQGVKQVNLDIRELAFMSSSCLRDVVIWLEKVRRTPDAERYLVAFLSSKSQPWQRRSLHALSVFALGMVTVEVS